MAKLVRFNITTVDSDQPIQSTGLPLDQAEELMDFTDNECTAGGVVKVPLGPGRHPVHIAAHQATSWWLTDVKATNA